MSDPRNFGLDELGQRVQAMGGPAPEPRLRPYQGGSLPTGATTNGSGARPVPAWEDEKPVAPAYTPYSAGYTAPAAPEPYTPLSSPAGSSNGFSHVTGSAAPSSATSAYSGTPPAAPQAALPAPAPEDPSATKTGLQRAVDAVRSALPLVQRLLPLLDGNFATAIGALVAPSAAHHPPPVPQVHQVHVDLEPVERGLAEVRTSHRELRGQVAEHGTALKRVEDHLERVREATDRNTLEQQELVEDLRAVGSRISTLAIVGLGLLVVSLGVNIYFLVQLQHILR